MNTNIRKYFPILTTKVHNKPLVYLDNAATTQKPQSVIDAITDYYYHYNSNIHRGVHSLAELATIGYEKARTKVREFINAKLDQEIVFVRGTTEAINLVAQTYGCQNFKSDDEIIISTMEHHSNIVPWQMICEQTGAKLRVIKIFDDGTLDLEHYFSLLNTRTKMVAITHVSNALGTIDPIKKIIAAAHAQKIPVLVDGAQAVAHFQVDVQDLDCDFYAFSGHKMYGPTGIGVLYGKAALLEKMSPYQGGGDMIKKVTFEKTLYADAPQKFEAGTQNIADTIGLGAAIDFLNTIGMKNIFTHEQELLKYANKKVNTIKELKIIGDNLDKVGVISFTLEKIHPHDVATILDSEGVAVRAGHHCNMPLMERFKIPGTTRVSLGMYNTEEEIDLLIDAIVKTQKIFYV